MDDDDRDYVLMAFYDCICILRMIPWTSHRYL